MLTEVATSGGPTATQALQGLVQRGSPEALSTARSMLGDPSADTGTILRVVADVGSPESHALLLESTRAREASTRAAAAQALGMSGTSDAEETLVSLADDPDPTVRSTVVSMLSQGGSARSRAVILRAFDDADPDVRRMAVEGVPALGSDREVAQALRGAMNDENSDIAVRALMLGLDIVGDDVRPIARSMALDTSRDAYARVQAAQVLRSFGERVDLGDIPQDEIGWGGIGGIGQYDYDD